MKLEIPAKVDFDDVQAMIDELKKLQTYKLFEGDDTVLVELDDVISILAKHIRVTHNSSESPNGWIPCSERLPDIKKHHVSEPCIVYCENGAYGFAELEENIFGQVGWDCERDDEYHEPLLGKVLAWMPLPEPWKEAKEC